jgi:hypothetical protein
MAIEAPAASPFLNTPNRRLRRGNVYWGQAAKNLLLIPIFPLCGYVLMDQTGISHALVQSGLVPRAILGEGFGHVGLCFSIHYLATAIQCLWKGFRVTRAS